MGLILYIFIPLSCQLISNIIIIILPEYIKNSLREEFMYLAFLTQEYLLYQLRIWELIKEIYPEISEAYIQAYISLTNISSRDCDHQTSLLQITTQESSHFPFVTLPSSTPLSKITVSDKIKLEGALPEITIHILSASLSHVGIPNCKGRLRIGVQLCVLQKRNGNQFAISVTSPIVWLLLFFKSHTFRLKLTLVFQVLERK